MFIETAILNHELWSSIPKWAVALEVSIKWAQVTRRLVVVVVDGILTDVKTTGDFVSSMGNNIAMLSLSATIHNHHMAHFLEPVIFSH